MKEIGLSFPLQLLAILCKPVWSEDDLVFIKLHLADSRSELMALAERHRVTPLLWRAHQKLNVLAEDQLNELEVTVAQNQLNALKSKAVQLKLNHFLRDAGVNGFFLKGVSLAERFYDDIAERHVLDCDVLVEEKGIFAAADYLATLGYKSLPDVNEFNYKQWKHFQKTHHDLYFYAPGATHGVPIELHWGLRGPLGSFKLVPKNGLDLVDEFLYLCVHGTEHGWFRLKWLMDLPRIINKSDFEWKAVWERAVELNCKKQLSVSLLVMDQMSIYSISNELRNKFRINDFQFELRYIFNAMTDNTLVNDNDMNRWKYFRYLWSFYSLRWDATPLLFFLTSPADWKIIKLPSSLFFLYFPLRPFLWIYRRLK